jgi:hypothetical protein
MNTPPFVSRPLNSRNRIVWPIVRLLGIRENAAKQTEGARSSATAAPDDGAASGLRFDVGFCFAANYVV